jgi:hypothetical protein
MGEMIYYSTVPSSRVQYSAVYWAAHKTLEEWIGEVCH